MEERDAFEKAMRGVDRLADDKARVRARRRRRRVELPTVGFEVTTFGDHQQGLRSGADSMQLRRLEIGDLEPEMTLDLHHLDAEAARLEVRAMLKRALRARLRVVRIVHGRGRRSPDGPVLKRALPGWLAEAPHGRRVLAFTTTGPFGAGGGATLVLLARPRG